MSAAIVDRLRGDAPSVFDIAQLTRSSPNWFEENYIVPARTLQRRGMVIDKFTDGYIAGRIDSDVPGVLVFSIPFAKGWSVAVDGVTQSVYSANLGFLAIDMPKGSHRVELRYALPGLVPGLVAGLLGLLLLVFVNVKSTRVRTATPSSATA